MMAPQSGAISLPSRSMNSSILICIITLSFLSQVSYSFQTQHILDSSSRPCTYQTFHRHHNENEVLQENHEAQEGQERENDSLSMILPIFPLRKRVKFPSEPIQLTLWEERYKRLAQNVLNQNSGRSKSSSRSSSTRSERERNYVTKPIYNRYHTFGIVYASHKPQIIKNGNEPITPLVECGDVGVLCVVREYSLFQNNQEVVSVKNFPVLHSSEDDKEPIVKETKEWNKIRLIGLGIERFQIQEILQNGYEKKNLNDDDSFILVRAKKIQDDRMEDIHQKEEVLKQKHLIENQISDRDKGDISLLVKSLKKFQVADMHKNKEVENITYGEEEINMSDDDATMWESLENWSFAIMSLLESERPAVDMLKMLGCTSIEERFEYITKCMK